MSNLRSCGSCNLCCDLLEINEVGEDGTPFAKQAWTLCRHCDIGNIGGCCTIYENRPRTCRDYRCAWLMGFGSIDDSPQVTKILVNPEDSEGFGPMLNFHELEPGVTRSFPPAVQLLEKARAVPWINAISITSSVDTPRKVYVRDQEDPEHWLEKTYESFRDQFRDGVPVKDWREPES